MPVRVLPMLNRGRVYGSRIAGTLARSGVLAPDAVCSAHDPIPSTHRLRRYRSWTLRVLLPRHHASGLAALAVLLDRAPLRSASGPTGLSPGFNLAGAGLRERRAAARPGTVAIPLHLLLEQLKRFPPEEAPDAVAGGKSGRQLPPHQGSQLKLLREQLHGLF